MKWADDNVVHTRASSAAPVGYRYNHRHHHYDQHGRRRHHHRPIHHDVTGNWCFWAVVLVFLAIFAVYVVLAFTIPTSGAHHHHYRRPNPPSSDNRVNPTNKLLGDPKRPDGHCRLGETYEAAPLAMCAPTIHTPLAMDHAIMDPSVAACDSFFHSMCGKWIDQHTNENRAFSYGYRRNMERIRTIVTSPSSGPVNDFYHSCVDTLVDQSRKSDKESSIVQQHMLGAILGDLKLHADLPTVFGRLARAGYTAPFALSIERHPTRNEMVPLFVWDGFDNGALNETVAAAIYAKAGHTVPEAAERVKRLMRITSQLALHNISPMSTIDDYVSYVRGSGSKRLEDDMTTVAALPKWEALADRYRGRCPTCVGEGWNRFFQAMDGQGLRFPDDKHPAWIIDHDYFRWLLGEGLTQFDIREWQAYVEFSILYNSRQFAPSLPSDVYFRQHDTQGPIGLGGRFHHRLPRHHSAVTTEDCIKITHSMLPGLVARHFLDEYFPHKEEIRTEVRTMVETVRNVFVDLIEHTTWMDDHTRDVSVAKLRAIKIRVAEPDSWIPEPFGNRMAPDRYMHNMNMIRRYRVQQNLALWHKDDPDELDRSAIAFFAMPLSSVNAFYSGPSNTITVLAGVLQHPFYNQGYDTVSKYAILGAIVGHEMSHSLDPNGINYDKDGQVTMDGWWSPESSMEFQARSQCIMDEYVAPGGCINEEYGQITLGEDMADLVGMQLAYGALRKAKPDLSTEDTQHFFLVWSQLWASSYDQKHRCERVKNDMHAVAEFRVDKTLRQLGVFQEAYGCHTGQAMYRTPADRCSVFGE